MLTKLPPFKFSFYAIIFLLSFLICLGLGYPVLNRYYPPELPALNDSTYYYHIVENGLHSITEDIHGRSTRIIVPSLARFFYLALPQIGTWNHASFSMLIVNSAFVSAICVMILELAKIVAANQRQASIAVLLYLLNYQVSNLFLAGLVDSGLSFFILMFAIICFRGIFWAMPIVALLGLLTKEVFLPLASVFSVALIIVTYLDSKKIDLRFAIWAVLTILVMTIGFLFLKNLAFSQLISPIEHASTLRKGTPPIFSDPIGTFLRFSYVFSWLLPLSAFSLNCVNARILVPFGATLIPIIVFGTIASIGGNGYARGMFCVIGPLLSICAAISLDKLSAPWEKNTG